MGLKHCSIRICSEVICSPWRVHAKEGRTCGPCGDTLKQPVPEGLLPMVRPHTGAILELKLIWERPTLERLVKCCFLCMGPHDGTGEEHEQEGVAGKMKPTFPFPLCSLEGENWKSGVKLSLGIWEGWK